MCSVCVHYLCYPQVTVLSMLTLYNIHYNNVLCFNIMVYINHLFEICIKSQTMWWDSDLTPQIICNLKPQNNRAGTQSIRPPPPKRCHLLGPLQKSENYETARIVARVLICFFMDSKFCMKFWTRHDIIYVFTHFQCWLCGPLSPHISNLDIKIKSGPRRIRNPKSNLSNAAPKDFFWSFKIRYMGGKGGFRFLNSINILISYALVVPEKVNA